MTFATGALSDMPVVGSGELSGNNNIVLSAATFEDGLIMGRFAKLDTGSIDNIDASVTPVVAGVVLRDVPGAVEQAGVVDANTTTHVNYIRSGLVTVDVKTGDTPAAFGDVFVHNLADANAGIATTTDDANTEPTNAEWIEEVQSDVWLIRLK